MKYPETVNLPFNATIISAHFEPLMPDVPDGGEPGWWAILRGNGLVVEERGDSLMLPFGERPAWLDPRQPSVLLGRWQGAPFRAMRCSVKGELPAPLLVEPFNAVEDRLDDTTLTLGGLAAQVLHWQRDSAVCSRCGGPMGPIAGTWGKHCPACRVDHFPHIHPCAIVLVRRNDEFLLIRKPEWAPGRYSLVAGFLDFGESLEECARREIREETGVEVTNIRYVGSQSWPFPSQLMAGFVADYAGGELRVDGAEIEDARWFCVQEVPGSLPSHRSIARWIIDRYALGKH